MEKVVGFSILHYLHLRTTKIHALPQHLTDLKSLNPNKSRNEAEIDKKLS
jgi:hypothetical protein